MADVKRVAEYIQRFSELIGVPSSRSTRTASRRSRAARPRSASTSSSRRASSCSWRRSWTCRRAAARSSTARLLELNYLATEDGAFAIDRESGRVYLRALRSLESLDFDEFVDMLDTVARVADEWDDKLRAQFGS